MMAAQGRGPTGIAARGSTLRAVTVLVGVVVGLTAVLWLLGRTNNAASDNATPASDNATPASDNATPASDNATPVADPADELPTDGDDDIAAAQQDTTATGATTHDSDSGPNDDTNPDNHTNPDDDTSPDNHTNPDDDTSPDDDTNRDDIEGSVAGSGMSFSPIRARLGYLSEDFVAVVDLETGSVTRVPIELSGSVLPLREYTLLNDGIRTVALSAGPSFTGEPLTAVLVASSAIVVPATSPMADYWVIDPLHALGSGVHLVAWNLAGYSPGGITTPAGSEIIVSRDPGLLVIPPTGKTFRPRLHGFEFVSDNRVLASNRNSRVEQRCDEQLICEVVAVDLRDGTVSVLPAEFATELSEVSMSEDGAWVLNDTSPAWLYDRHADESRLLEVGGYGGARWTQWPELAEVEADSHSGATAVAWLTTDRTPALVVARTKPRSSSDEAADEPSHREAEGWIVVELGELDAVPVPGSSFILW